MYEEALIRRDTKPTDDGNIIVQEEWDLRHPMCPFIPNPFSDVKLPDDADRVFHCYVRPQS